MHKWHEKAPPNAFLQFENHLVTFRNVETDTSNLHLQTGNDFFVFWTKDQNGIMETQNYTSSFQYCTIKSSCCFATKASHLRQANYLWQIQYFGFQMLRMPSLISSRQHPKNQFLYLLDRILHLRVYCLHLFYRTSPGQRRVFLKCTKSILWKHVLLFQMQFNHLKTSSECVFQKPIQHLNDSNLTFHIQNWGPQMHTFAPSI